MFYRNNVLIRKICEGSVTPSDEIITAIIEKFKVGFCILPWVTALKGCIGCV